MQEAHTCCSDIVVYVLSAGLTLARQLQSSELNVVIIDGCACPARHSSIQPTALCANLCCHALHRN